MEMQAHMVLGLLQVAFALHLSLQPYATPLVNTLETSALGVLMLTFWVSGGPMHLIACSFYITYTLAASSSLA